MRPQTLSKANKLQMGLISFLAPEVLVPVRLILFLMCFFFEALNLMNVSSVVSDLADYHGVFSWVYLSEEENSSSAPAPVNLVVSSQNLLMAFFSLDLISQLIQVP